jgi:hypothetical protein
MEKAGHSAIGGRRSANSDRVRAGGKERRDTYTAGIPPDKKHGVSIAPGALNNRKRKCIVAQEVLGCGSDY